MKKTILLADDSVTIRKVVELTFMGESFELISVGSGTEAVERVEQDGDLDLVIADVHMPGADGYEVCRAVKRRSPSIPVLLLVGTFENFEEQEAEKAGADDHLKKPFDSQDLLSRVRALLADAPAAEDSTGTQPEAAAGSDATAHADGAAGATATSSDAGEVVPEAAPAVQAAAPTASHGSSDAPLSEESVDRIARRVVELLSEEAIRNVAWEVIPDLAEVVIKERLDELESQVE